MRILVIDDDLLSLSGLKMALEQRGGHQCATFGDPELALEALQHFSYDAVICDIRMPKLTGLDILKIVRQRHPEIPVILMTGFRDSLLEVTTATQGAYAVFLKPLRTEQLLDTLRQIQMNPANQPSKQ